MLIADTSESNTFEDAVYSSEAHLAILNYINSQHDL